MNPQQMQPNPEVLVGAVGGSFPVPGHCPVPGAFPGQCSVPGSYLGQCSAAGSYPAQYPGPGPYYPGTVPAPDLKPGHFVQFSYRGNCASEEANNQQARSLMDFQSRYHYYYESRMALADRKVQELSQKLTEIQQQLSTLVTVPMLEQTLLGIQNFVSERVTCLQTVVKGMSENNQKWHSDNLKLHTRMDQRLDRLGHILEKSTGSSSDVASDRIPGDRPEALSTLNGTGSRDNVGGKQVPPVVPNSVPPPSSPDSSNVTRTSPGVGSSRIPHDTTSPPPRPSKPTGDRADCPSCGANLKETYITRHLRLHCKGPRGKNAKGRGRPAHK